MLGDITAEEQFKDELNGLLLRANAPRAFEKTRAALLSHFGIKLWGSTPSSVNAFVYSYEGDLTSNNSDLWEHTLATMCDLYAKVPMNMVSVKQVRLVVIMNELAKNNRWQKCLASPDSARGLVRNLLVARRIAHRVPGLHDIFTRVFNSWATFDGGDLSLIDASRYVASNEARQEEAIVSALFGEHFWLLTGSPTRESFDLETIVRDAPMFTPGLLPQNEFDDAPLPGLGAFYGV